MDASAAPAAVGASSGDPVNLATGEEEYQPGTDLTVYNPVGPSVVWGRQYRSLRNEGQYELTDFGQGWSQSYNISVYDPALTCAVPQGGTGDVPVSGGGSTPFPDWAVYLDGTSIATTASPNGWDVSLDGDFTVTAPADATVSSDYVAEINDGPYFGQYGAFPVVASSESDPVTDAVVSAPGTKYIIEPNGSRLSFTASAVPTADTPVVSCPVEAGVDMLVEWDYDPACPAGRFVVTQPDRTKWVMGGGNLQTLCCPLSQIVDRNGNALNFHYGSTADPNGWFLLSSITNGAGTTLLSISRDDNGLVTSVSDAYGRSVYYAAAASPYGSEVGYASQVVTTGTSGAAGAGSSYNRYSYSYQTFTVTEETTVSAVFLHTITVPSPTGSGSSTATINYSGGGYLGYVTSIVDGNGNSRIYIPGNGNTTGVSVQDASGNITYEYTVSFDNYMNETSRTDGCGNPISSETYSDPNDPYRPSQTADGNASPAPTAWYSYAVPQGGSATMEFTGTAAPAGGADWDILDPSGTVVASSTSENGWNVSPDEEVGGGNLVVITAPSGAALGSRYTARYGDYSFGSSAQFNVVTAASKIALSGNSEAGTTSEVWDSYGNLHQETSPRGTVTNYTYAFPSGSVPDVVNSVAASGAGFGLGELTIVQQGDKSATTYTYYEPSGLTHTVTTPTPGTAGGTGSVTTT
jgi:hypothetical protein